jgi:hypothetical protein
VLPRRKVRIQIGLPAILDFILRSSVVKGKNLQSFLVNRRIFAAHSGESCFPVRGRVETPGQRLQAFPLAVILCSFPSWVKDLVAKR